jgi:carbonic anhydrase
MISGQEALARLREGNRGFVASIHEPAVSLGPTRRLALPHAHQPFAIVLGCSDARVPAELVFGQGFGDLFVIRVAGNIVAPSQVGSVEFAAARFGTRLAVVLGHTQCGAIAATVDELRQPASRQSPNLRAIVDRIRPAVEPLLGTSLGRQPEALIAHAVRANVRAAADHLRHGSAVLERLVDRDGLVIVGAEYSLETGIVDFFDGAPEAA